MSLRPAPADRSPRERFSFGVVNVDKPPGPSAHEVTAWVRDLVGVDRAAHAGTLDPKVTGCLPILTGEATRLAQAFLAGRKEYVAVLELHRPAPADAEAILAEFETELYQRPPRKSAVRRRLRTREVYALEVLDREPRRFLLHIECESGTYVRKLCHDLGLALGTGAHMGSLRRIGTEPFDDRGLVTLQDLTDALALADDGESGPLADCVAPAERALTHLPRVIIAESAARQVAEGAPVYAPGVLDVSWLDDASDAEAAGDGRSDAEAAGDGRSDAETAGDGRSDAETAGDGQSDHDRPTEDDLLACYTPNGAVVCLGRLVGDPSAERGEVVTLERVLV